MGLVLLLEVVGSLGEGDDWDRWLLVEGSLGSEGVEGVGWAPLVTSRYLWRCIQGSFSSSGASLSCVDESSWFSERSVSAMTGIHRILRIRYGAIRYAEKRSFEIVPSSSARMYEPPVVLRMRAMGPR